MRYRKLDADGDYVFGSDQADFYINSPDAVAQAVQTRLLLMTGEWFLDTTEGTPYSTDILGNNTKPLYDTAIRNRILGTQGVTKIVSYTSSVSADRELTVNAIINTLYGEATVNTAFTPNAPSPQVI